MDWPRLRRLKQRVIELLYYWTEQNIPADQPLVNNVWEILRLIQNVEAGLEDIDLDALQEYLTSAWRLEYRRNAQNEKDVSNVRSLSGGF